MKKDLIQPNQLTVARYDYNVWEKRIMYKLIDLLQKEMKKEVQLEKSKHDVYFSFSHQEIDAGFDAQKEIKKALRALRAKEIIIENGKEYWIGGLINWGQDKNGKIEISINNHIVPFLTDIAKGFTAYSAVVAMALKSSYSQRLYELCSRFKDTKKWFVAPDTLREMLNLPKSYENYKNLRMRVLDAPQKELKELFDTGQCDLHFSYQEIRSGRGRGGSVKELIFTIHTVEKKGLKTGLNDITASKFQIIANFMREHFDTTIEANIRYMNNVLVLLSDVSAKTNFDALIDKIELAKKKENPAAYFRAILKKDFNIT